MEKLGSSRSPMEEREKHFFVSAQAKWLRKKRDALGRKGKGINTPQPPTITQVMAVPLSMCGTATPGKTTRVRVKCWLYWL